MLTMSEQLARARLAERDTDARELAQTAVALRLVRARRWDRLAAAAGARARRARSC